MAVDEGGRPLLRPLGEDALSYRPEDPRDVYAIRSVNAAAFGRPEEAALVDALRASGSVTLSLVADLGGSVVGHILYSPVAIDGTGRVRQAVGLAPMAVRPDHQRTGIGTGLIERSLQFLRGEGHAAVVVLGHSWFYPRFGFQPADRWGLRWEHPCPPEAFMALELHPGALSDASGTVRFCSEFEGV